MDATAVGHPGYSHILQSLDVFSILFPASIWLGKISFPLYLVQFPIIISITSFLRFVIHGAAAHSRRQA